MENKKIFDDKNSRFAMFILFLFLLVSWFWWFEYMPYSVRKNCTESVFQQTDKQGSIRDDLYYDFVYRACMNKHGLESEYFPPYTDLSIE